MRHPDVAPIQRAGLGIYAWSISLVHTYLDVLTAPTPRASAAVTSGPPAGCDPISAADALLTSMRQTGGLVQVAYVERRSDAVVRKS